MAIEVKAKTNYDLSAKEKVLALLEMIEQRGFELTDVQYHSKNNEVNSESGGTMTLYVTLPIELTFQKPE